MPDTVPQPPPEVTRQRVIRVTDEQDGELLNRGYSYWSQACRIGGYVYLFVGSASGSPLFFEVNEETGAVVRKGHLLPFPSTGEGMFWTPIGRIIHADGPRLLSSNPFYPEETILFDIAQTHPGCRLWQPHAAHFGMAYSATVQKIVESGPYPAIGTVVCRNDQQQFFPADTYALDESQVDASGRYLLIKSSPDDDNLWIDLNTGQQWPWLRKAEGAVGHSDSGRGFVVGADRAKGTCVRVEVPSMERTDLFPTWSLGHVAVRGSRILISDAVNINLYADGLLKPIQAHGMVNPYPLDDPRSYDYQVFANLSPDGAVACYLSNVAGRMDAYLLFLEG